MEATTEEGEAEPGSREVEICEGLPPLVLSQRFVGSSGCQVWDAGITLLAYLTRLAEPLAAHPRVVEVGSGTGVVGLGAAALGAAVVLTDLPGVLPLLRHNLARNEAALTARGGSCDTAELAWGEDVPEELRGPAYVLAADCVFEAEAARALVATLEQLCFAETTILMANEIREHPNNAAGEAAFSAAAARLFVMERVPSSELHPDYACEEIAVVRLRRRGGREQAAAGGC